MREMTKVFKIESCWQTRYSIRHVHINILPVKTAKMKQRNLKKISKKCISDLQVLTLASFNILFIVNSCYKKKQKIK